MKRCFEELFEVFDAIVFFDTETSGLDCCKDKIIELAALSVEKNGLKSRMDEFIRLPEGETIPSEIVELTHITDEMLRDSGISSEEAARRFHALVDGVGRKNVLLAAHNAQFDLTFLRRFLRGHKFTAKLSFLDTVTVYKDRAPYPHKLEAAITHYSLEGAVKNSHRAIDDVEALFEVTCAMDRERADLISYINLFGYNAKYGEPKEKIAGVTYKPQGFTNFLRKSDDTLPNK